MRDRLVCGLRSDRAPCRLLADADGEISLNKAIQLAQRDEQAEQNSKALKGLEPALKKLSYRPRRDHTTHGTQKPCYRCGRSNHAAKDCKFTNATCHFCHKKGHIAPACLKKKRTSSGSSKNTKHLTTASEDSDEEEFHLHTVSASSAKPIMVTLKVEGKNLAMELDTGAAFSVISEEIYRSTFTDTKLRKSNVLLKTYTDEQIPVIGQLNVHVEYQQQRAALVLLVVARDGPALLGRNWHPVRLERNSCN